MFHFYIIQFQERNINMEISNELLNGEKIIYIATRLFNIQDKMAGNIVKEIYVPGKIINIVCK